MSLQARPLKTRIRYEDSAALKRLGGKMTKVTQTAAEKDARNRIYKRVRARLGQESFSDDLVTRLEAKSR